jgi:hypothetical protein
VLIQAVKRNIRRFPADFMFQLTDAEWTVLRSCRWASHFQLLMACVSQRHTVTAPTLEKIANKKNKGNHKARRLCGTTFSSGAEPWR